MRPRARLISLIGNELISDEPVAVVELVKNSYDADAATVVVRFEGEDLKRPERIVVEDDGVGMGLKTVVRAWLEPATDTKRLVDISPRKRRVLQGAKGIGRFAAARLAKSLRLETKREIDSRGVEVTIEWGDFEERRYLSDIDITYRITAMPGRTHGTRLVMEGLRKVWKERDFEDLENRLSRLISPFDEVKDFEIQLQGPAYYHLRGPVQPPVLLSKPRYHLRGTLSEDGSFTGSLEFCGRPHRQFVDHKLGGPTGRPACGGFEVEIRAWDRDREGLEAIGQEVGMGIAAMRKTLTDFSGVSIYRDGFRVYPYGQMGDDWLTLDARSRQNPVMCLANNQVVASIKISRQTNPGLVDRSNREGMVLNSEHLALETWFKTEILTLLESERYRLRPREEKSDLSQPLFEGLDLAPTLQAVRKQLGVSHPVTTLVSDADKRVKAGVERIQEAFSRLIMLSGLGHMVDIVIHEIGAPIGKLNKQIALLERDIASITDNTTRAKLEKRIAPMKSWLDQVVLLRQRLDPQTPAKRGRATAFYVKEEVEDCLQLYESLIRKQGVVCRIVEPDGQVRVMMARSSLSQVLVNLIDNALYWITRQHGEGKGGNLSIAIRKIQGGFSVRVMDDGIGVAPEDRARIFEPYFTTRPNGMGLGLHIARLVIEPYGKILLADDGDLSGACFEALFQQKVGL